MRVCLRLHCTTFPRLLIWSGRISKLDSPLTPYLISCYYQNNRAADSAFGIATATGVDHARIQPSYTRARRGHRRGDRGVQRRLPSDAARLAGCRRRRTGAAVRDGRLYVARAGFGLSDQPFAHDDQLRQVHGGSVVGDEPGRRAVRQPGRQHGGRLDAGALGRPEAQGGAGDELGSRGAPDQPVRGARQDSDALASNTGGTVRAVGHPHEGDAARRGHGAGSGTGRRGEVLRRSGSYGVRDIQWWRNRSANIAWRHQNGSRRFVRRHLGAEARSARGRTDSAGADGASIRGYDAAACARGRGGGRGLATRCCGTRTRRSISGRLARAWASARTATNRCWSSPRTFCRTPRRLSRRRRRSSRRATSRWR